MLKKSGRNTYKCSSSFFFSKDDFKRRRRNISGKVGGQRQKKKHTNKQNSIKLSEVKSWASWTLGGPYLRWPDFGRVDRWGQAQIDRQTGEGQALTVSHSKRVKNPNQHVMGLVGTSAASVSCHWLHSTDTINTGVSYSLFIPLWQERLTQNNVHYTVINPVASQCATFMSTTIHVCGDWGLGSRRDHFKQHH